MSVKIKSKKMLYLLIALFVLFLAWVAWGYFSVRSIESPDYKVLNENEGYEVREYAPYLIAEVKVFAEYDDATNEGFRKIADYIFGNNNKESDIAMTTPVVQEESEVIAMTTPVVQEGNEGEYLIYFVMPKKYSLDTLPKPNNSDVRIKEIAARKVAVLSFSGWFTEEKGQKKLLELKQLLEADGLNSSGKYSFARYNPPWTPPFMNKNEVWIEL